MIIQQSGVFRRRVKKLHSDEKQSLDSAVKVMVKKTTIGQLKIGDLAGVFVYKYKCKSQQYLLAYKFVEKEQILTLLALGTH